MFKKLHLTDCDQLRQTRPIYKQSTKHWQYKLVSDWSDRRPSSMSSPNPTQVGYGHWFILHHYYTR